MIRLSARLALSRIRTNRSGLDLLAVIAFAVTAFLALTVAGGTFMFIDRASNPPAALDAVLATSDWNTQAGEFAGTYVYLAVIASAILVIPILSLGGGAARLGAAGRARRLASLRLIGMTGREVVLTSVIESLVLTVAGALLGTLAFFVSLPLWQIISFHGAYLSASEMVPPWWAFFAVIAVILLLSALSTVIGLQRVVISPLGVARRETPKALQFWRVIVFIGAIVLLMVVSRSFNVDTAVITGYLLIAAILMLVLFSVNLVGPWIIQLIARPFVTTSNPATLLAMRRLVSQPRDAWRNVGALAFIAFIAALTAAMPIAPEDPIYTLQLRDIGTGTAITLAIGLIVAATSTLINQASFTVDRGEQTVALTRMGTPRKVFSGARYRQVLLPLLVTLGIATPLGLLTTQLLAAGTPDLNLAFDNLTALVVVMVGGLALCLAAAGASKPIETKILTSDYRRND